MQTLKIFPLIFVLFLSGCVMDETQDLASLLIGTYKGKAADEFTSSNGKSVVISKISNDEIEIKPQSDNIINTVLRIRVVQDGNWIKQANDQMGVSFEAKASKNRIPMKFSTDNPIQSFEGNKSN